MLSKIVKRISLALESYKRVLVIAKKPDKEEIYRTLKICLTIMGILGLIGFVFYSISILFLS